MGTLISLEGISGTGKTTVLHKLETVFRENSKVIFLKEVFDETHIGLGKKIFDSLYHTKDRFFDMGIPYTETMLLLARLMYQYESVISKALAKDCIVITDRGVDSVVVAQAIMAHKKYDINISDFIEKLDSFLSNIIPYPDKTFLLYGCADDAIKRAELRDQLPFTVEQNRILKSIENQFVIRANSDVKRFCKLNIEEKGLDEIVNLITDYISSEITL